MPSEPKKQSNATFFIVISVFFAVAVGLTAYAVVQWNIRAKERNVKNPVPPSAEAIAEGSQIYQQHCQSCHGAKGDGKGEKAAELSTAPGDFTDARKMSGLTDGEIFAEVTKGHHPMPEFGDKLTVEERWDVVDYVRTFAAKPSSSRPAATVQVAKSLKP
ncbi:MAG TPA: cytochrome c [Candidatus Baltobacteraceae bacterium]|nr:cytochrome c [Candidatus Baltobacteraceae bacterium]